MKKNHVLFVTVYTLYMLTACTSLLAKSNDVSRTAITSEKSFSSCSLIESARAQNYPLFEKLVISGANLNETNERGMNVQLSLAYFNDDDFTKACELLNEKGFDFDVPVANNISLAYALAYSCSYEKLKTLVQYPVDLNRRNSLTDLTPIEATQYGTYLFYSEQIIDPDTASNTAKIRDLLKEKGSEECAVLEPTLGNIGNFFFCFGSIIGLFYPEVTPYMLNSLDIFTAQTINNQIVVTVDKNKMLYVMNAMGIPAEVNMYTNPAEIADAIAYTETSEEVYVLIAQTGNNPIAPFQWVIVHSEDFAATRDMNMIPDINNPDALWNFIDFQIKDISQLITVRIAL